VQAGGARAKKLNQRLARSFRLKKPAQRAPRDCTCEQYGGSGFDHLHSCVVRECFLDAAAIGRDGAGGISTQPPRNTTQRNKIRVARCPLATYHSAMQCPKSTKRQGRRGPDARVEHARLDTDKGGPRRRGEASKKGIGYAQPSLRKI
jgi:hypothetical protein